MLENVVYHSNARSVRHLKELRHVLSYIRMKSTVGTAKSHKDLCRSFLKTTMGRCTAIRI